MFIVFHKQKILPIYCVETNEKNIALTINCTWSQLQMEAYIPKFKG